MKKALCPCRRPGSQGSPKAESKEKDLPQKFQMLKILAGEKARKDTH